MKRMMAALLIGVMLLAGCGKKAQESNPTEPGVSPVPENPTLTTLKEDIKEKESLFGVAYLGYSEGDFESVQTMIEGQEYSEDLSFLSEIAEDHFATNEGGEVYAIVPLDETVTITVSCYEYDGEYTLFVGEELLKADDGKPILVRGNISEIVPNIYISAEKDGTEVEFIPLLSGMDGKLVDEENVVYDFTPYDKMVEFTGHDRVPDEVFCGDWVAFHEDEAGTEWIVYLSLLPDGTANYSYGIGNSELFEMFEGTWENKDNGNLGLDLWGGPIDLETGTIDGPYSFYGEFAWDFNTEHFLFTHVNGNGLLYGEGETLFFLSTEE